MGKGLRVFLPKDEQGLLLACDHEKLHAFRCGVVAGRIHEVLGGWNRRQIDARSWILIRCRKINEWYKGLASQNAKQREEVLLW